MCVPLRRIDGEFSLAEVHEAIAASVPTTSASCSVIDGLTWAR